MIRITLACPEGLIDEANYLVAALGSGPDDLATFAQAEWVDADGHRFSCASWEVASDWQERVAGNLLRPDWDRGDAVDLDLAQRAQSALRVWGADQHDEHPPLAEPGKLVALIGLTGAEALAAMGLARAAMAR